MPWKETNKMNQRTEFVMQALQSENFAELCKEYGISRKTGYKWKERFLSQGMEGLDDHSRRPKSNPNELPESMICELIRLKQAHMTWGPQKIRALYIRANKGTDLSLSSVKRILEKAGMVRKRKKRRVLPGARIYSERKAEKSNDVWTVDFKGWWRDPAGEKCEPLTIRDEFSRYVLCVERTADGCAETVKAAFERIFERYGLPGAIRSDNGTPFACTRALQGLSYLSAWWLALGIGLERGRPGCPQDNGAHERMHLDIARELEGAESSQAAFDQWRKIFNDERPHASLGDKTPAEVYEKSARKYKGTPDDLEYKAMSTRRVQNPGHIRHGNNRLFLSTALRGWSVGLKHHDENHDDIYFTNLYLGRVETATGIFIPAGTGRNENSVPSPQEPKPKTVTSS